MLKRALYVKEIVMMMNKHVAIFKTAVKLELVWILLFIMCQNLLNKVNKKWNYVMSNIAVNYSYDI